MGILRTILAIAVVVFHSYKLFGLRMCGGQVAVESFYMISGFYMALILNEKYIGIGSYKKFIVARFYRIFPIYWIILMAAVLLSVIGYYGFNSPYYLSRYISNYNCLSPITILYFVFENIVVMGQDVLYFLRLDELCNPIFTNAALSYKHTANQYLFVPQAWSISIEFMFYLIAPFLVTKSIKWQLSFITLGLVIRYLGAHYYSLFYDPWTYRFFPFELPLFLMGSLAYQVYKYMDIKLSKPFIGYALLVLVIVLVVLFYEIKLYDQLKAWIFYIIFFISIPFIFNAFKNNKTDRYIGELSFSIYISHLLLISVLRGYFFKNHLLIPYYGYAVVLGSIFIAILLNKWVINPLEKFRLKKM